MLNKFLKKLSFWGWLTIRDFGFDKDSFVQIYPSDCTHRKTVKLICRDAPYDYYDTKYGAFEKFLIYSKF